MIASVEITDGTIGVEMNDVVAFSFVASQSQYPNDNRANQLSVWLKSGHQLHFLGVRADMLHTALLNRFPVAKPFVPPVFPSKPKKKSTSPSSS